MKRVKNFIFVDKDNTIHKLFWSTYKKSNYWEWSSFIESENLGVKYINVQKSIYDPPQYEITDQRKWLITKLKYALR